MLKREVFKVTKSLDNFECVFKELHLFSYTIKLLTALQTENAPIILCSYGMF